MKEVELINKIFTCAENPKTQIENLIKTYPKIIKSKDVIDLLKEKDIELNFPECLKNKRFLKKGKKKKIETQNIPINESNDFIELKTYDCSYKNQFPFYINLTNECNGKCKFCSNLGNKINEELDLEKLKIILDSMNQYVNRFAISGGEPMLHIEKLEETIKLLEKYNKRIIINSNGTDLNKNIKIFNNYNIEAIQLSRHHYSDTKNNEVFGIETLSLNEIKEILKNTNKDIRMTCVLMKGYIDSKEEVKKYLEIMGELGIFKIGFSTLNATNKFCIEKYVDYNLFGLESDEDFILIASNCDKDICSCKNYLYVTKKGVPIFVYFRNICRFNNVNRSLFYQGDKLERGY